MFSLIFQFEVIPYVSNIYIFCYNFTYVTYNIIKSCSSFFMLIQIRHHYLYTLYFFMNKNILTLDISAIKQDKCSERIYPDQQRTVDKLPTD